LPYPLLLQFYAFRRSREGSLPGRESAGLPSCICRELQHHQPASLAEMPKKAPEKKHKE
jgi:hypothetical protein